VSFAAIKLCVASQRVFFVVVYFVIDSVRKFLGTLSYMFPWWCCFLKSDTSIDLRSRGYYRPRVYTAQQGTLNERHINPDLDPTSVLAK